MAQQQKYKIGLDEVGRGPLAGPITVGCVALPTKCTWSSFKKLHKKGLLPPLRDSKKLTELQREKWYQWIVTHADITWAVGSVSAMKIDRMGITRAGNTAAHMAYTSVQSKLRLTGKCHTLELCTSKYVRLDKGLTLRKKVAQKAYVKGDELYVEIALASILAKVTRDKYMHTLDRQYKVYGFAENKGYGSKSHYNALASHGLSKMHRSTFIHL